MAAAVVVSVFAFFDLLVDLMSEEADWSVVAELESAAFFFFDFVADVVLVSDEAACPDCADEVD